MWQRTTMIRLAGMALATTVLTAVPAAASAAAPAAKPCVQSVAVKKAAAATPAAVVSLSCDSGSIYVSAYGTGLTPGARVNVTRTSWGEFTDGTHYGEQSRTRTEIVAANGTVRSQDPFGTPPMTSGWTYANATITDLAGNVLAVSPESYIICPCCW